MRNTSNGSGLSFQRLDVYQRALELVAAVGRARLGHAELTSQVERASLSVFLNLSEGLPLTGGNRRRHLMSARASAHEVVAAVDAAVALGVLEKEHAEAIKVLCDRVSAMLWRLAR